MNRLFSLPFALAGLALVFLALSSFADDAAPAAAPAEAAPAEAAPAAAPPVDVRQVQMKVWISETSEGGVRDLGANLDFTRFVRGQEMTGSVQQVTTSTINPLSTFGTVAMPYPHQALFGAPLRPDLNPATTQLEAYPGLGLEFSILDADYGTIDGIFQSLETRSDLDLISKPEIMVANTLPATIKAGGQVPFQDVTFPSAATRLQVSWRDIGVNLNLTPTIMPNNFVQLAITQLEVSDILSYENLRGADLPVFSTRSQSGVVFVPDGTTLVVGGLTSRTVRKTERRVPVLGSVPLLGIPFRSRKSEAQVTSLLVFVSPTIVDMRAPTPQAKTAMNFWRERGGEWTNRPRIDREVDAMQTGF
ncbi:MAG TPA: type II and III secretion system protein [Candidatus Hydrogenedentes bacterium]|nr:type II and III secretion system protein [Candidatus Hydrogenedentota bacterium]